MPTLDDVCLESLFSTRYLDFETSCNLRLVSSRFNRHAVKYYRSLEEFDFGVLSAKYAGLSKGAYARLFNAVTEHCANLRCLKRLDASEVSFDRVARLTHLTRLELVSFCASESSVAALKQLVQLRSVAVEELELESHLSHNSDSDDEWREERLWLDEHELLRVPELRVDSADFMRVFSLEHVEKLAVTEPIFGNQFTDSAFGDSLLSSCPKLASLEQALRPDNWMAFMSLLDAAESLPRLRRFCVTLVGTVRGVRTTFLTCPQMVNYVTKLRLSDLEPHGILKLDTHHTWHLTSRHGQ